MDNYKFLTEMPELDVIEEEYVIEESTEPLHIKVNASIHPLTVQIGEREGKPHYRICEVSVENESIFELFRYDFDEINETLKRTLLFEDIEEMTEEEITESYLSNVEDAFEPAVQAWEGEGATLTNSERETLYTYIHREYLQAKWLTAPVTDPTVDSVIVSASDGLRVVRDGTEYATSITFDDEDDLQKLRVTIIQLAQRAGEHISAADPTVEVENRTDMFNRPLEYGYLQLSDGEENEDTEERIELVF